MNELRKAIILSNNVLEVQGIANPLKQTFIFILQIMAYFLMVFFIKNKI